MIIKTTQLRKYLGLLLILISPLIIKGQKSVNPTDTFSYRKIEVIDTIFSKPLKILKDSLNSKFQSSHFDYIRVLYNDSNEVLGIIPHYISELFFDYAITKILNESEDLCYLFEVDNILFQINIADINKLNIKHQIIEERRNLDINKWKVDDKKKYKRKKHFKNLSERPFVIFKINNNAAENITFKTKPHSKFGVNNLDF